MTHALLDLPDVLARLDYTPQEHVSVCNQRAGGAFTARTMASSKATINGLSGANIWFGVNPIDPTSKGRGTANQVIRWSALFADLDIKTGGCKDIDTCRAIVDVLSDMLTSRPVALIYSGHGLQPLWALDPQDAETRLTNRGAGRALLRRFGRLVASVAEKFGADVDSVFDLARVLRAPGSTNHKNPSQPVEVLTVPDTGHPLTLNQLRETLDAYGIPHLPEDSEELGAVLTSPSSWAWAPSTCGYAATTTRRWVLDTPTARHPWLMSAAVRLAAMNACGCITLADHKKAKVAIAAHFHHLLATVSPQREATPGEISQAFGWGQAKASTMPPERLAKELGNHNHDVDDTVGPFGFVPPAPTIAEPSPTVAAPPAEQPPPANPSTGLRHIVLTSAADIKPRPVFWLWKNRLALGTLGLLAGREGTGKSTLSYWLTARLTRGELYGIYQGTPRAVLVCATEDSWEHTIVPRLIAAGADLSMVYRVEIVNADDIHVGLSLPRDLLAVERAAIQTGAALLLLDPLMSRLGDLDTHRDAEVRQALEPLVAIADRTSMAILGLIHHNKSGSSDPLQLVMGSKAFTAVARSVHTVVPDPDDDTNQRRLFGTPKNNLGRNNLPTFSFQIVGHQVDTDEGPAWTGRLEWGEELEGSIDDIMRSTADGMEDRTATKEATDWLSDYMSSKGGQVASSDAKNAGRAVGHSERTLKRAASKLHLILSSSGFPRVTFWEIPAENIQPSGATRAGGPTLTSPTGPTALRGDISPSTLSLSQAQNGQSDQLGLSDVGTREDGPTVTGCYKCGKPPMPGRGICADCAEATA